MIQRKVISDIVYNSQRDNKLVENVSAGSQCGYTSLAMILSEVNPGLGNDDSVAKIVKEMESKTYPFRERLYKSSIENFIKNLIKSGKNRVGAFMEAYHQYVSELGVGKYKLVRSESPDYMKSILDKDVPIMIGTKILPSGHYIVVVGYDEVGWIVNDPWGDGVSGYKNRDGKEKVYPYKWLASRLNDLDGKTGRLRAIHREV